MLFSSIPFLYVFLPATLLLYFAAPRRMKNAVLLLCSLVFYGWGEPKYLLLMLFSIAQGYLFGLLIEKYRGKTRSTVFFWPISNTRTFFSTPSAPSRGCPSQRCKSPCPSASASIPSRF